jgi:hypothetical protein
MATHPDPDIKKTGTQVVDEQGGSTPPQYDEPEIQEENTYAYDDSRKLGVTGAVFLILNKMIGTGSMYISRRMWLQLTSGSFLHTVWHLRCNWVGWCILVSMGHR